MNYAPPQRSNARFPLHPSQAGNLVPAAGYRSSNSQATGFRQVSVPGGNLPRFQYPTQYPDESGSVASEQTHMNYESQVDMLSAVKTEVGEILKAFTQVSAQQTLTMQESFQSLQSSVPTLEALRTWQPTLEQSLKRVQDTASEMVVGQVTKSETVLKSECSILETAITTGVSGLKDLIAEVKRETLRQRSMMQRKLRNIEKKVKPRAHGKKKASPYYAPGTLGPIRKKPVEVCECLLKAGKRMTRKERVQAVADGTLVCTCKT